MITKPTESNGWIDRYIAKVNDGSLIEGLKRQTQETLELLSSLTEDQLNFRYAEGKWSIKELAMHLIDTERIFCYRALRFSRKDKTPLPGFDENVFVANGGAASRDIKSIIEEYIVVRTATVAMFSNFTGEMLDERGIANNIEMSPRALGFGIIGHEAHHVQIIRERYLV